MKKVSVIIPVYNKEKSIKKCILSVINQNYSNLEIIIVDDGSTDGSSKICKQFEHNYDNILYVYKENGGVEKARLVGIDNCTGDYVTFVDSDDWLADGAIDILVKTLEENNADISFGKMTRVIGKHGIIKKETKENIYNNKLITKDEFIQNHLQSFCGWGSFPVNMWGKMYKKELLDNIDETGLTYGEDLCFNLQVIPKAQCMKSTLKNVYFYAWGGVTTFINKKLFNDAIKQYLFKIKVYENFQRQDCIEMSNVELCNFYIGYCDMLISSYGKRRSQKKIDESINNNILQHAVHDVTFEWFNNNKLYNYIKEKDTFQIINLRYKMVMMKKVKIQIIMLIDKFL